MSPTTHLLASWIVAAKAVREPRDCRWIALAGLAPDLDGLGLVVDIVTGWNGHRPTAYYPRYHHYLFHGIFGALITAAVVAFLARDKVRATLLALAVFHFHLVCDLVGSRGPAPQDLWPIFYLGPFSRSWMWFRKGQWPLEAWPNRVFGTALLVIALWLAVRLGHSVVGVFNRRADATFVAILRQWNTRLQTASR